MKRLSILSLAATLCIACMGQTLEEDFMTPPDASKPIMIWQWMDGLISREGIRADLEAYKEAGIGGVQNFQVGGTTQGLAKDTTNAIGSVRWQQLMRFAIDECSRLGLSFGTHNCPGWSSSAYPTVKPQYAMQKLVWTSINVASLDKPWPTPEQPEAYDGYYEDIATIAVPKEGGGGTIYRFGHTANGKTNSGTAPESGVGLECDKMSREAVEHYWAGYPTLLLNIAGEETGKTFQRLEIDSYEAGGQEWTKLMPQEFKARKGYDILPWLPALAGEVIESKEATERFMRDWRETVTDLFAENYYGYMSQLAHRHGLQLLVQPYGTGSAKPFNPINTDKIVRQLAADDPVSAEFWAAPTSWGWKDIGRVANAARRNGHETIYAEGFTCWPLHAWRDDPARLKALADSAFCLGVNKLMLHAAAHNPWVGRRPGMTFGMWGTWWTPGQTWWKDGARPLFTYFARCQALLQRGRYVDDYKSTNPSLTSDIDGIQWIHRKDGDADIYFIANAKDAALTPTLTISTSGRLPEVWNPETATMNRAEAWIVADGKTHVKLQLNARSSVFIILRKQTYESGTGLTLTQPVIAEDIPLAGPWSIEFEGGKHVEWPLLMPWNESADKDIKYYSGTARYEHSLKLKKKDKHSRYVLDLGNVKNLAVVSVNGQTCGTLWRPPFCIDITSQLHKGDNIISIDVTNLWVNRMVGDEHEPDDVEWSDPIQFGASGIGRFMKTVPDWLRLSQPRPSQGRKAVVSIKYFDKNTPLLPSGLIGPVVVRRVEN